MPKRIQRRRSKGWKMPEGAVYVGRPTKWGNPYIPQLWLEWENGHKESAVRYCVDAFRAWLRGEDPEMGRAPDAEELRGKDLVCWCPLDHPCHADVLLEIANGRE